MAQNDLGNLIEAILFWQREPLTYKDIIGFIKTGTGEDVHEQDVQEAVALLSERFANRGISLIITEAEGSQTEIELRTGALIAPALAKIDSALLAKDIGKAGMETLAIILYEQGASRSRIDYIRGVNSQYAIRTLMMRGFLKRIDTEKSRNVYIASTELLAHLGITSLEELPDRAEIFEALQKITMPNEESNTARTNSTETSPVETQADSTTSDQTSIESQS